MDLLNNYIEMMGDMEFALYVASFVFGLIFLIGLIGKLAERKVTPGPIAEPKVEPKPKEEKQKEEKTKVKATESGPVSAPAPVLARPSPAVAPVPSSATPPLLEGVMTWEFDDGKKKKKKMPPPTPLKSAGTVPPPAPVATAAVPAPPVEIKETDKTSVSPAVPPVQDTRLEDKTMILPPKEAKGTVPTPSGTPSPAVSPAKPEDVPALEKSFVDFQMYETLIRRIAGLEADLKRDPLYLDPLMKRMGNTEKRLDELATKGPTVSPAQAVPSDSAGGEVKELKEKVEKLQKLLEQLSEGPSADASLKTSNYP